MRRLGVGSLLGALSWWESLFVVDCWLGLGEGWIAVAGFDIGLGCELNGLYIYLEYIQTERV